MPLLLRLTDGKNELISIINLKNKLILWNILLLVRLPVDQKIPSPNSYNNLNFHLNK